MSDHEIFNPEQPGLTPDFVQWVTNKSYVRNPTDVLRVMFFKFILEDSSTVLAAYFSNELAEFLQVNLQDMIAKNPLTLQYKLAGEEEDVSVGDWITWDPETNKFGKISRVVIQAATLDPHWAAQM